MKMERPLIVHVQGKLWPRILLQEAPTTPEGAIRPREKEMAGGDQPEARRRRRETTDRISNSSMIVDVNVPDRLLYGCCSSPSSSVSDIPSLVSEVPKDCNWKRCTLQGREVVVTGEQWFRIVPVKEIRKQQRKARRLSLPKATEVSFE